MTRAGLLGGPGARAGVEWEMVMEREVERCEVAGCGLVARYGVGGGAAARMGYCEEHAKDLCACEAWWFAAGQTSADAELGEPDAFHSRERCGIVAGEIVTREAGTPGGTLLAVPGRL